MLKQFFNEGCCMSNNLLTGDIPWAKRQVPQDEGSREFLSDKVVNPPAPVSDSKAADLVPGASTGQEPTVQAIPPANEAFSVGVSLGLASYYVHTLIDMADNPQKGLINYLLHPRDRSGFARLLCEAAITGDNTMSVSMSNAMSRQQLPPPHKLMRTNKAGVVGNGAIQANVVDDSDVDLFSQASPAAFAAVKASYIQVVDARDTSAAKIRKIDAKAGRAIAAGANIGIAEGFATRGSDATDHARKALTNAQPDVVALGLDTNRLQAAIDFAVPGADQKVLHDMVMTMRISFEASLLRRPAVGEACRPPIGPRH